MTRLLQARDGSGHDEVLSQLVPLIYDELRALASRRLKNERADHTLQATALVHEAYARLVDADIDFEGRAHFFAIAAQTMRRILVDHARAKGRVKRGGGAALVTLEEEVAGAGDPSDDLLDLDAALDRLAALDARKAKVVELHFFGGLTYAEIAGALGISDATVDRDLRMAKAWLSTEMADESEAG